MQRDDLVAIDRCRRNFRQRSVVMRCRGKPEAAVERRRDPRRLCSTRIRTNVRRYVAKQRVDVLLRRGSEHAQQLACEDAMPRAVSGKAAWRGGVGNHRLRGKGERLRTDDLKRIVQACVEYHQIELAGARRRHCLKHAGQIDAVVQQRNGRMRIDARGHQHGIPSGLEAVPREVEQTDAAGAQTRVELGDRLSHLLWRRVGSCDDVEAERRQRVAHRACVAGGVIERIGRVMTIADHESDASVDVMGLAARLRDGPGSRGRASLRRRGMSVEPLRLDCPGHAYEQEFSPHIQILSVLDRTSVSDGRRSGIGRATHDAVRLRAIRMRSLEGALNNDSTLIRRQNVNESGVSFWQVPS